MPLYAVPFFAVLLFYVMAKEVNYMPCPHFNNTITQRSRGHSAVAGAAYQRGEEERYEDGDGMFRFEKRMRSSEDDGGEANG